LKADIWKMYCINFSQTANKTSDFYEKIKVMQRIT